MRKILLLSVIVISLSSYGQDLKGIFLGKTTQVKEMLTTTIAGINGILAPQKLNDGRVYQILFITSEIRIYDVDVTSLKEAVEGKFGIKLKKTLKNEYADDYYLTFKDGNIVYYISVEVNDYTIPSNKTTLIITDESLRKIHQKEESNKTKKDI